MRLAKHVLSILQVDVLPQSRSWDCPMSIRRGRELGGMQHVRRVSSEVVTASEGLKAYSGVGGKTANTSTVEIE